MSLATPLASAPNFAPRPPGIASSSAHPPAPPAVPSPSRPAPPPARSAPHPSADSSARNSELRGPETPSPGRAGPAAGKKRALSVPRTPAPGRVRNPATPGGSPPRPFLSPAPHRLPKPGRLPARGPYSSSRWRARTDVITLGGPVPGGCEIRAENPRRVEPRLGLGFSGVNAAWRRVFPKASGMSKMISEAKMGVSVDEGCLEAVVFGLLLTAFLFSDSSPMPPLSLRRDSYCVSLWCRFLSRF